VSPNTKAKPARKKGFSVCPVEMLTFTLYTFCVVVIYTKGLRESQ